METKRSTLQNTVQYNSSGHRVTTGLSKSQVTVGIFKLRKQFSCLDVVYICIQKNGSGVSLTPSQISEQAKLNVSYIISFLKSNKTRDIDKNKIS